MIKVAILGCENSHADTFIDFVLNKKLVTDVEFVGVFSEEKEATDRIYEKFKIPAADSYDAFVGKIDALIITARNGENHYKYAKPYIASKIPMFIDKPITNSEEDAIEFMAELEKNGVPVCGGSCCVLTDEVKALAKAVREKTYGEVFGGFLRAPVNLVNNYGGFFFYSQHLVQVMCEIFGNYPDSVKAYQNGNSVSCIVRYPEYDVSLQFVNGSGVYYATVSTQDRVEGGEYTVTPAFEREFMELYELFTTKKQTVSYTDFIAPVFIMNAIKRSLDSGCEEKINRRK